MNILDLSTYKNYIFIGDPHGIDAIQDILKHFTKDVPDNTIMFFCGDIGLGFNSIEKESKALDNCNNIAKKHNYHLILVRGNHDNPNLYVNTSPLNKSNITVIEDYTLVNTFDKNVLCIGGAISIDRSRRTEGKSYWKNETVKPIDEFLSIDIQYADFNIDIICAHSSPTYIKPINTSVIDQGKIVQDWSIWDSKLKQDNWNDRHTLNDIYEFISKYHKISHWIYGHFHDSFYSVKNNTEFIGLDCFRKTKYFIKRTSNGAFYKQGPDIYDIHDTQKYNNVKFLEF